MTTRYDFTEAAKQLHQWYSPSELSANLKDAALRLSCHDEDIIESLINQMQQAVLDVCDFLDKIKTKEVAV